MRRQIPQTEWDQLRAAYMAGAGLRQLARNAGINEGTVLVRANREQWSAQRDDAKTLGTQARQSDARDHAPLVPAAQVAARSLAEGTPGLSLIEKRNFLRSVVTTPIGQVDESSPLAQSVKRRSRTTRSGDTETETDVVRMRSQMEPCRTICLGVRTIRAARYLRTDDQGFFSTIWASLGTTPIQFKISAPAMPLMAMR